MWNVPVQLEQSDDYPELANHDLRVLWLSLPGGSPSGGGYSIGPKSFSYTLLVEADTQGEAESLAPDVFNAATDHDQYPGWLMTDVGDAHPED